MDNSSSTYLGSIGFNRTFMELKLMQQYGQRYTGVTFQSYLYGIEILVKVGNIRHLAVSIVPLWN